MTIKEKKENIINLVQNIDDELLIDEVYDFLHTEDSIETIYLDNLPKELQHKLSRAMDDYNQGKYITNEQMKTKIQQWLMK